MADITRRIGLSLGADLCWPLCFEEIIRRLDLALASAPRVAEPLLRAVFEIEDNLADIIGVSGSCEQREDDGDQFDHQ